MSSKFVRGFYVVGCNHAGFRPPFYKSLGLWQGSINIQLPHDTNESLIVPRERRAGLDPIDLRANQDFLIRACRLKGAEGYQVLPIDKTTNKPTGHHASKIIEIALKIRIDIKPNGDLVVELLGFDG